MSSNSSNTSSGGSTVYNIATEHNNQTKYLRVVGNNVTVGNNPNDPLAQFFVDTSQLSPGVMVYFIRPKCQPEKYLGVRGSRVVLKNACDCSCSFIFQKVNEDYGMFLLTSSRNSTEELYMKTDENNNVIVAPYKNPQRQRFWFRFKPVAPSECAPDSTFFLIREENGNTSYVDVDSLAARTIAYPQLLRFWRETELEIDVYITEGTETRQERFIKECEAGDNGLCNS